MADGGNGVDILKEEGGRGGADAAQEVAVETCIPAFPITREELEGRKHKTIRQTMIDAVDSSVSTSVQLDQLKNEIGAKQKHIDALPPLTRTRQEALRDLGFLWEQYEMLIEVQRIESVVGANNAQFPPILEDCPLCLESVAITSCDSMAHFLCCGNGTCRKCYEDATLPPPAVPKAEGEPEWVNKIKRDMKRDIDREKLPQCPLCRSNFTKSSAVLVKKWAEKGRLWAQAELGMNYFVGQNGVEINAKECMKWIEIAAEQYHPMALWCLSTIYSRGEFVQQNKSNSIALMNDAADWGNEMAQYTMGVGHFQGQSGFGKNLEAAAHYLTLAYNNEGSSLMLSGNIPDSVGGVAAVLGLLHLHGEGGFEKSNVLAKHYLDEAANKGCKMAFFPLALAMTEACNQQFQGEIHLPSPGDAIPRRLYWARKASAVGDPRGAVYVDGWKQFASTFCFGCRKMADDQSFKCCAKCKSVYYCSKECHARSWKNGHKLECIKQG